MYMYLYNAKYLCVYMHVFSIYIYICVHNMCVELAIVDRRLLVWLLARLHCGATDPRAAKQHASALKGPGP